jgi:hypothetical protein
MRTMTRSGAALRVVVAMAVLSVAGCDTMPTSPALLAPEVGPMIARDSLVAVDSQPLPCCSVDSAGRTVTVVGGTLTFHRLASYTDTVATPGGLMSAACVTQVPNGAAVHPNGLVTVGDSIGYLTVPCSKGTYALVVSRRADLQDISSDALDDTVSAGTYQITNGIPDRLTLVDLPSGVHLTTTLSWDTVTVATRGHRYRLVAALMRG